MDLPDIKQGIPESAEDRRAREFRTQQNQLAPISRLPGEILAHIFVHCVPTHRILQNDLRWALSLTVVCSHWRSVALACPSFWSTIIFSRPKWTPVMLARSKMASLVARLDLRENYENSPAVILFENASRLGTLDLYSPQPELTAFMTNLEHADAAPRLQSVKIVNTDEDNLDEGGIWLPTNLFRRREVVESRKTGTLLGLRLHLECCAFPWDSSWYSHLTHLHLVDLSATQRPTMEAFLAILVASPNLETLAVIHSCPTTGHTFTVELPHLTSLIIKGDSSCPYICSDLLGCLIVPSSAAIDASCTINEDHDTETIYHDLIPMFSKDLPPATYDTVHINCRNAVTYSLHHSAHPAGSGLKQRPGLKTGLLRSV